MDEDVFGRRPEPRHVADSRLRAEGRVMEIGPGDLALTLAEAASLLREAGITGRVVPLPPPVP